MRLVLDTSVVVSGFRSRDGASYRLLRLLREGKFTAVATPTLLFEYETVLKRNEQRKVHGLSKQRLEDAICGLAGRVEAVHVFQWKPQLRDPDDELVLEAAINGMAYAIVTHNVRDFLPAADRFGIRVLPPGVIMRERFS